MISPGKLWWQFSRDVKRGWDATYHHRVTLPRVEDWFWPYWSEPAGTVPVHVLTGENDWRLSAWMLASFFHFTERAWPIVFHDDGTLSHDARATLGELFPEAELKTRAEADAIMGRVLRAYPFCEEYRRTHPLALKIFDVPHTASSDRFFLIDSDVLFFQRPAEILAWADAPERAECWFNEDVQEAALLSAGEAREELDVKLWSRVNSGLCLINRSAIDLELCDRALATTSILRGPIWRIEQTLFALCASRHALGGLLPQTYEVSLKKRGHPDAIARHYVGAVRDRFFAEGLKRLREPLLELEPD